MNNNKNGGKSAEEMAAAERKRKRLEAWRKRQKEGSSVLKNVAAESRTKISVSLGTSNKKRSTTSTSFNLNKKPKKERDVQKKKSVLIDEDEEEEKKKGLGSLNDDDNWTIDLNTASSSSYSNKRSNSASHNTNSAALGRRWKPPSAKDAESSSSSSSRWGAKDSSKTQSKPEKVSDELDKFMNKLEAGAMGDVTLPQLKADVGGSVKNSSILRSERDSEFNSDINTDTEKKEDNNEKDNDDSEDEDEQEARRKFIQALKSADPTEKSTSQLASEIKSQKHIRQEQIKTLEKEALKARHANYEATPSIGRLYNDNESGVMDEAERELQILTSAPDALEVLAELNKKKELKAVDHSKIEYIPITKNLYIVPRALASLTKEEIHKRRNKLKIKVRGVSIPAPLDNFAQSGIAERILNILEKQNIHSPFPIQAQCLPIIMTGRDCIGIAKTGSGKTLAYLLPMLRHILDQEDLQKGESGPIGLVLAPARELAVQIHSVCRLFAKHLNMKTTAVYGGAGVAEQIADLKRGVHISVATPGRMIDILTMQSGKLLSLQRVSYVVLDEADRMFDLGFAPQISAILSAIRPDRQTVLFSATFPKTVEALAKKSLQYPIEVIVGGRSVASDSIEQHAEVIPEEDKFLRLLQLLGEQCDDNKKVIVFVDTQAKADAVFEQLIRCGYPSLSLHGGKEQEDRDSTIADFKLIDGPNVLVATSVAGRGLDVSSCTCVINYNAPNHLEDYVHRVGRTGRAGNKGYSFTFVNPAEEAKFAPIVVRAMTDASQDHNISEELKNLSNSFKEKVERGEAKYAGSGFKGKGYTYDSSEMNEAQKLARLEKREALIEAGLLDPDEDNNNAEVYFDDEDEANNNLEGYLDDATAQTKSGSGLGIVMELQNKLTADVLSLPGMQEAIFRKAGINNTIEGLNLESTAPGIIGQLGPNHFVDEIEINDYPREARWKVTQKETTSRLQDEFQTAVTLKGEYYPPNKELNNAPLAPVTERKLYLHLEATTERSLKNCVYEIRRLLNEETLRVGLKGVTGGGHRYNVL